MQNDWRKISIKENDIEKFGMFYDLDEEGFLLLRTKMELKNPFWRCIFKLILFTTTKIN